MSAINHIMMCKGDNSSENIAAGIVSGSIGAISGWLTARIFTHLSPMIGFAFGAFAAVGGTVAAAVILHNDLMFRDSKMEKIAKYIMIFFAGIVSGYLGVLLIGCQLTFEASLILGTLMVPTSVITFIGLDQLYKRLN